MLFRSDGTSALARASAEPYDLLVLDVMLPGLDGLSLCRAIRNGRINHDVPILMLTARGGEMDRVAGLDLGADDYFTKPFRLEEMEIVIRRALEKRRLRMCIDAVVASPDARAEGFGLNLADAMAMGLPVIATGYSANLEFMPPGSAELLPWFPITIERHCGYYRQGLWWAEPERVAAAAAVAGALVSQNRKIKRFLRSEQWSPPCFSPFFGFSGTDLTPPQPRLPHNP